MATLEERKSAARAEHETLLRQDFATLDKDNSGWASISEIW